MKFLFLLSGLFFLVSCDYSLPQDYNVMAEYNAFVKNLRKQEAEAKLAMKTAPKDDGGAAMLALGKEKFNTYCTACHGVDGMASGPAAAAMNPKPRNFTDKKWQKSVDDARLVKILKEGGPSVGLSASMSAWSGVLSDSDIDAVVAYVREFGK